MIFNKLEEIIAEMGQMYERGDPEFNWPKGADFDTDVFIVKRTGEECTISHHAIWDQGFREGYHMALAFLNDRLRELREETEDDGK